MEQNALLEVWQKNYNRFFKKAALLICDFNAVEDMLQEAVLKAWMHRDTLRSDVNCYAWLRRIVHNECISYMRKALRQGTSLPEEYLQALPATQEGTEQYLYRAVWNGLLRDMPVKNQRVFLLRCDGYCTSEIAEILSIPEGTVKSRMYRARSILKRRLDDILM
ncbi:MAG: RNA polymerase sigma factor [Candidatus Limiplasma sp.]|nr:RNA polymerase sigma factor [Candidatus Limiplasma sp.]